MYPFVAMPFPIAGAGCGCGNDDSKHAVSTANYPALPAGAAKPDAAAAYGGIIGFLPIVLFPAPCQNQQPAASNVNAAAAVHPLFTGAFPFASPCGVSPCGGKQ